MKQLLLTLLISFSFLVPIKSEAAFITIETTTSTTVRDNVPNISVSVTNKGDESAHNVRINIMLASKQYSGRLKDVLGKGLSYTEEFSPSAEFKKAGRYPFLVNVSYTDANLYPFSALSVSYINYKEPLDSLITGTIPELALSEKGSVRLTAKNIATKEIKFKYEFILPREFMAEKPGGEVTAGPGTEKVITSDIENISALAGSKYPVFALLSYEDDKYYYSTIASGSITVGKKNLLYRYKTYLIVLLAVLILIVIFYNLKGAGKRASKG